MDAQCIINVHATIHESMCTLHIVAHQCHAGQLQQLHRPSREVTPDNWKVDLIRQQTIQT